MKIKDIPFRIPDNWSAAWYRNHFVEVIAQGDWQNGTYITGSDVSAQITAHNADPFSHPDVINAHVAQADPHSQYFLKDWSGDVQIGTDLHSYTDDEFGPYQWQYKGRGTQASPSAVQAGDYLGGWGFGGWNNGMWCWGSELTGFVDSVSGTTITAGFVFRCSDGSGAQLLQDRIRIYGDGGLVVGAPTGASKGAGTVNATAQYVNGIPIFSGAGTPEGAVTAPVGALFLRTDGGAGTCLYVKESGSGNTGWIGK